MCLLVSIDLLLSLRASDRAEATNVGARAAGMTPSSTPVARENFDGMKISVSLVERDVAVFDEALRLNLALWSRPLSVRRPQGAARPRWPRRARIRSR